jgi:hypothetical protein
MGAEGTSAMPPDLVLTFGTSVTLGIFGTLDDIGSDRFLDDIPVVFTVVADSFRYCRERNCDRQPPGAFQGAMEPIILA